MSSTTPFAPLLHERVDGLLHFLGRVLVEGLERDVADVIAENLAVRHGGNLHDAAREAQLDRLGHAGRAYTTTPASRACRAARSENLGERQLGRRRVVHRHDPIAFANARLFRRRVREDAIDDDDPAACSPISMPVPP
jgi:hypothetical protein